VEGYVREKTYRLVFEDDDLEGLVVRARAVDLATFLRVAKLTGDGLSLAADNEVAITEMVELVGLALIEWNLQDATGEPVPADAQGLRSQDKDFTLAVINAWIEAVAGVARPLGQPSPGGDRSLEASLPMAVPSPSLAS
jgi:hypothetical protein